MYPGMYGWGLNRKWEYVTTRVTFVAEKGVWTINHPIKDGVTIESATMGSVLSAYGELGWELVNLADEQSDYVDNGPGKPPQLRVNTYRAVFKRPTP